MAFMNKVTLNLFLLLCWLSSTGLVAAEPCSPPSGADAAIQSGKRFLIFGETHGTQEMPRAFGEIVCAISAKRPVVVALEFPVEASAAFGAYLASQRGEADWVRFLADAKWADGSQDGRKSRAMLEMVERLGALKAAGKRLEIATFVRRLPSFDPARHEAEMAAELSAIATRYPGATVAVLGGNLHAQKATAKRDLGYAPMASVLPQGEVFSTGLFGPAGTAWVCVKPDASKPMVCGPHDVRGRSGLLGDEDLRARGFDHQILLGSQTASPPAAVAAK
jgi:hypothetical protein